MAIARRLFLFHARYPPFIAPEKDGDDNVLISLTYSSTYLYNLVTTTMFRCLDTHFAALHHAVNDMLSQFKTKEKLATMSLNFKKVQFANNSVFPKFAACPDDGASSAPVHNCTLICFVSTLFVELAKKDCQ